jgi:hypothetical protein
LQLLDVVIFALHVCVEKAASLGRIARIKPFVPTQALEFKEEVQDEKRVSEIYVRVSSIAERLQVHR